MSLSNLFKYLQVYTPSCTLWSSSDTHLLTAHCYKWKQHSFCSFAYYGPHIWNDLPYDIRHCETLLLNTDWKLNSSLSATVEVRFHSFVCVCKCACMFVCACVQAWVHACVSKCLCTCKLLYHCCFLLLIETLLCCASKRMSGML